MPRQTPIDAPGVQHHLIIRGIDRTVVFGVVTLTGDQGRQNPFAVRF